MALLHEAGDTSQVLMWGLGGPNGVGADAWFWRNKPLDPLPSLNTVIPVPRRVPAGLYVSRLQAGACRAHRRMMVFSCLGPSRDGAARVCGATVSCGALGQHLWKASAE
jgi:hypothetical protein